MPDSRFGCRPWICSSVTTLTGASASIARSSVFEAATVIVSSDCTGAPPICARAFIDRRRRLRILLRLGLLALGLLLLLLLGERVTASASSACVNAALDDINANENADAPKTKARECLDPESHTAPTCYLSLGFGWRAPR